MNSFKICVADNNFPTTLLWFASSSNSFTRAHTPNGLSNSLARYASHESVICSCVLCYGFIVLLSIRHLIYLVNPFRECSAFCMRFGNKVPHSFYTSQIKITFATANLNEIHLLLTRYVYYQSKQPQNCDNMHRFVIANDLVK